MILTANPPRTGLAVFMFGRSALPTAFEAEPLVRSGDARGIEIAMPSWLGVSSLTTSPPLRRGLFVNRGSLLAGNRLGG